jgi:endonuclease III-like uncharacterized protein
MKSLEELKEMFKSEYPDVLNGTDKYYDMYHAFLNAYNKGYREGMDDINEIFMKALKK